MFRSIKNYLFAATRRIVSSIAFYPTIIALSFLLLSFVILNYESHKFTKWLNELAPLLVLNDADTARAILTTLIGGILSFTVFSFSMVMLLLSQASSNFSPRLLPGLISDKRNQIVLGTYLGTIIYNIIVLVSIHPDDQTKTINGFSIILGIIFGILCLAMFVFFIHSISTGIQINNILEEIFITTKNRLESEINKHREETNQLETDSGKWHSITAEKSGYFQDLNIDAMLSYMEDKCLNVKIVQQKGVYLLPNMEIFKVDKNLTEEEQKDLIELLIFSSEQTVEVNYVMGMKQITEVGIKAMSPGINDPGTAIMTIDYITELLLLRLTLSDNEIYVSKENKWKLDIHTISFSQLIYEIMAPYRQYCKHDFMLVQKLAQMLKFLQKQEPFEASYKEELDLQIKILKIDVEESMTNSIDKGILLDILK